MSEKPDIGKVLVIGLIFLIALILASLLCIIAYNSVVEYKSDAKECSSIGGTVKDYGIGFSCYDTDEDGYRFYYKKDSNGWYKEK